MILFWKGTISLLLFVMIFIASWWADAKSERYVFIEKNPERIENSALQVSETSPLQYKPNLLIVEPFKSREYIKIRNS